MHCMQYATDIELHVHSYAVGVADIAASEGSPHNVLHSSSIIETAVSLMVSHIMAWDPCSSSLIITMKACAQVVVI